ncbi:hypothetical protein [Thermocrinis sp.]
MGIALGIIYVEILFRLFRRGYLLPIITYPIRVLAFTILMAVILLKGGALEAIILTLGFFLGLLLHTLIRGFVRVGVSKLS